MLAVDRYCRVQLWFNLCRRSNFIPYNHKKHFEKFVLNYKKRIISKSSECRLDVHRPLGHYFYRPTSSIIRIFIAVCQYWLAIHWWSLLIVNFRLDRVSETTARSFGRWYRSTSTASVVPATCRYGVLHVGMVGNLSPGTNVRIHYGLSGRTPCDLASTLLPSPTSATVSRRMLTGVQLISHR